MDINYVYIILAATFGGIVMAVLGLLDSGDDQFDPRKFCASILRALVAGCIFAYSYELEGPLEIKDIIFAFVTGTTFEVGVNRIAGAMGWGSFPIPSKKGVD